jgi:cytochrome c
VFRTGLLIAGFAIAAYLAVLLVSVPLVEASPPVPTVQEVSGSDPARGRTLIGSYGCGSCHLIPGVPGANSLVGPPLTHYAKRSYIAGNLPNTPENLMRWLQFPQQVEPGTAMPNLNVTLADAHDIASYLYGSSEVTVADLLRRWR